MHIQRLKCIHFKNHFNLELLFSAKLNIIFGNNGVGKTNILDSIHYLSTTKSFFSNSDLPSIQHDKNFFTIEGEFCKNSINNKVNFIYKAKSKKIIKHNDLEYETKQQHIGIYPVIFVTPDCIDSIKGPSELRRKLFDSILCQINNDYLSSLMQYNKILQQRNAFLKDSYVTNNIDEALLDYYDNKLLQLGYYIFTERKKFLNEFNPCFEKYYNFISGSQEIVNIDYDSIFSDDNYISVFKDSRAKDLMFKYTTKGIHRDDYIFSLNNFLVKIGASQGQKQSFVISLKLAQSYLYNKKTGVAPVLLLDDIFNKLDSIRIYKVIELICKKDFGQIFITDTDQKKIVNILDKFEIDKKVFKIF